MKNLVTAAAICLVTTSVFGEAEPTRGAVHSFVPPSGFVPDEKTAIRIALAIWEPIYGEKQIASEKPYRATLKDGVWEVTGSLPGLIVGGSAVAEISKRDGTILRVSHGQ